MRHILLLLFSIFALLPGSITMIERWLNFVAEILSKWIFYHGGRQPLSKIILENKKITEFYDDKFVFALDKVGPYC